MRIVITGRGIVSPVGTSVPAFWDALRRGHSGIRSIERFDTSTFTFTQAGVVDESVLAADSEEYEGVDIGTGFLLNAAEQALHEAGVPRDAANTSERTAIVLGTNFGGSASGEKILNALNGNNGAGSEDFTEFMFHTAAEHVAACGALAGPREVLSLSCSSGTAAIARAVQLLRNGRAEAVLVGGYDALSAFAWSGLSALRTMTRKQIQPFDKNRSGTIFSEGAGCLFLEPLSQAVQRGASVFAEVAGCATNNNAFHMTAPSKGGAGSASVMKAALEDAEIQPSAVDHVNAHGTGTRANDSTETQAIKSVFGNHAYAMPITSIKSMTGHMMGAAGMAEAIACVETVRTSIVPPTINYSASDPECDLDVVTNEARECDAVRTVLSNSAGIGGCNAAVVVRGMER